jgi:(p)ppGpp synthase/HD superfamily hydrolase
MGAKDHWIRVAADFAGQAHAGQVRKGADRLPYFVHLEAVVSTLSRHGYDDETTLAAAYLHDVLEDQPAWATALRETFPLEIVRTVELLSEQKLDSHGEERPKEERFQDSLAMLAGDGPQVWRARAVSCADYLDNANSLLAVQRAGDQLLARLATRPGQQQRHHESLRELYAPVVRPSLLAEFDQATAELTQYVAGWLPSWAITLAAQAHLGQSDRGGAPYMLHPLRMMLRARTAEERIVAVLHDVVEDGVWTLEQLANEGFSPAVLRALDCVTRRREGSGAESYDAFVERVATDSLAARVKLLDLEDNLDMTRLSALDESDCQRLIRYQRARRRIREILGESAP